MKSKITVPGQTITRSELPRPIGFFGRLATYALLFLALYIYFEPKDLSHTPLASLTFPDISSNLAYVAFSFLLGCAL